MIRRRRKQRPAPRFANRPRMNQAIQASEVQVIGEDETKLGVMSLSEALRLANQAELDLVEVVATATPPIVRIIDVGKFMYEKEKKKRENNKNTNTASKEVKTVRITFRASDHDLEVRARQADGFFKKGNRVRIELKLKGRERAMEGNAREKIEHFLAMLQTPHNVEGGIKKSPTGIVILLLPKKG